MFGFKRVKLPKIVIFFALFHEPYMNGPSTFGIQQQRTDSSMCVWYVWIDVHMAKFLTYLVTVPRPDKCLMESKFHINWVVFVRCYYYFCFSNLVFRVRNLSIRFLIFAKSSLIGWSSATPSPLVDRRE